MQLDEDSKQAFAALATRYVDLVYAAAWRQVQDQHLAEDVTQAVFIVLARKMPSLQLDRPLGPWLLQTTKYIASNARRSQFKRQLHERRASQMAQQTNGDRSQSSSSEWNELSPLLDEGINRLPGKYREALVMRYFETMSLQQVGATLGISEAAAAKRVSRAVEKLRHFFKNNGMAVGSSAALSTILSIHLAQSAPVSLASTVTTGAANHLATNSAAATLAKGAILMAAAEKLKVAAFIIVILALSTGVSMVVVIAMHGNAAPAPAGATPEQNLVAQNTSPAVSEIPFTGGSIRILGMSDDPMNPTRWWLPDGSLLDGSPPGFVWRAEHTQRDANQRALYFIARLTSAGLPDPAVEIDLSGGLDTSNVRYAGERPSRTSSLSMHMPVNLSIADATLRIASGPWRTHAEYDLSTRQLSPQPPEITIKSVTEGEERTLVALRYQNPPGPKLDRMITVITNDGKRIGWSELERIGTDGDQVWKFRCRLEEVKQVVYESRPFEERRLRNVSIEPATITRPQLVEQDFPAILSPNSSR